MFSGKGSIHRLIIVIFVSLFAAPAFSDQPQEPSSNQYQGSGKSKHNQIELTEREKAFLQSHPVIRLGTDETGEPFVSRGTDDILRGVDGVHPPEPDIQRKPPFRTIIVDNYYPYTFVNESGEPDGFSVDLMRAVAKVMGFKIWIDVGSWEKARNALKTGEIDFLPMMAYSKERDKEFDFSSPHTIAYDAFFTRQGSPEVRSLSDLRQKKIVVMKNDQAHDYLRSLDYIKDDQLIFTDDLQDSLRRLAAGKGDAALMPKLVGLIFIKKLNLTNLALSPLVIKEYKRPFSIAVNEGNQELLERLNQGLSILKETDQRKEIFEKWFGSYESINISVLRGYA